MPTPNEIKDQINRLIRCLVEIGLSNEENFAYMRSRTGGFVEITFRGAEHVPISLRECAYDEVHGRLSDAGAYNVRMLDGALIQMMFEFCNRDLNRHRLAFFPAPNLEEFQNNPAVYLDDEVFADIIAKKIVPFPVRFDYDARVVHNSNVNHPKSHLTLGQYENCRIPVTAPMTPFWFVDFILRNFYHSAFGRYADRLPVDDLSFSESIRLDERSVIHIVIPV